MSLEFTVHGKRKKSINYKLITNNSFGFTLVEVLISMSIAVIVSSLLVVIIVNSAGLFYKQSAKVGQGVGVNEALAKFRDSIKEANAIASGYPQTPPPAYTTSPEQVVLSVPSIDNLGNILSGVFDYYVFLKEEGKLKFKVFPDIQSFRKSSDQTLSINVKEVVFLYFDSQNPPQQVAPATAERIRMVVTLRQRSGADYEESMATSEASLRND